MIRINLLPVRRTQQQQSLHRQLAIGVGAIGLSLLLSIIWDYSLSSRQDELQKEIAEKQQAIKKLDQTIGTVNEYTKTKEELKKKLDIIEQLKKGKTGPVRAMDDLATDIPDRVWLTELTEQAKSVSIKGLAIDHEDVSALMKALQKSKYFSNIVLGFSKATKKPGGTVYEFLITCQVNYSA